MPSRTASSLSHPSATIGEGGGGSKWGMVLRIAETVAIPVRQKKRRNPLRSTNAVRTQLRSTVTIVCCHTRHTTVEILSAAPINDRAIYVYIKIRISRYAVGT